MTEVIYHYDAGAYVFHVGNWFYIYADSKREAIQRFRELTGTKGKHIKFTDYNSLPSLSTCIAQLVALNKAAK